MDRFTIGERAACAFGVVFNAAQPPTEKVLTANERAGKWTSSTLLPDGRWLLLGGSGPQGPVSTATLKDPVTGVVTVLPSGLLHARTGHTATLLPNGAVLIFGGADGTGHLVAATEMFDPSTLKFSNMASTGLTPRAYHSANLLTDGRLLVAGGLSATGDAVGLIEIWDFRTNNAEKMPQGLLAPRSRQISTLLADGTVSLWGGVDNNGAALTYGEIFDPTTLRTRIETSPPVTEPNGLQPSLNASIPQDDASNVSSTPLIALRFSVPLDVSSLNTQTVILSSSQGPIEATIVPAEGGIVCFITTQSPLATGTTFSVSVDGAKDWHGMALPGMVISFTTAGTPAQAPTTTGDSDLWVPTAQNFEGSWKSGQGQSPLQALPPLQAATDVTALAGQALRLNGTALPGVTLQIGSQTTTTDQTGRFLLTGLSSGHQVLLVDGTTANKPGRTYGIDRPDLLVQEK